MYLLDTCVISDLSPEKSRARHDVADWLRRDGENCYISVVTLTEIAYGVAWLRHRGANAKAARLGAWHEEIVHFHDGRIIPVDIDIARRAGVLLAIARAAGVEPDTEDPWIAATADVHGMTVLTSNDADFRPMGVAVSNPAAAIPPDAQPRP